MPVYTVTLEYIVTRQVEIISLEEKSHQELSEDARRVDLETYPNMPVKIRAMKEVLKKASCIVRDIQTEDLYSKK